MRNSTGLHRHTHAEDGTQRTQWIDRGIPRSTGHDMASQNPFPYVGTTRGTGNRAGRKVGQIKRP
jgi:hypothetical protein